MVYQTLDEIGATGKTVGQLLDEIKTAESIGPGDEKLVQYMLLSCFKLPTTVTCGLVYCDGCKTKTVQEAARDIMEIYNTCK